MFCYTAFEGFAIILSAMLCLVINRQLDGNYLISMVALPPLCQCDQAALLVSVSFTSCLANAEM